MSFWDKLAEETARRVADRVDVAGAYLLRAPAKCPVCEGHGEVPAGFYTLPQYPQVCSTSPFIVASPSQDEASECRACRGKGFV